MMCGDVGCAWFGYAHRVDHPCGVVPAALGEACEYCGVMVQHIDGCPWCWHPIGSTNQQMEIEK